MFFFSAFVFWGFFFWGGEPWETFSTCLIVLDHLQEVFGFSIVTDFMSIIIGFSVAFSCWVIIFDHVTIFFFKKRFKVFLALLLA